MEYARFGRLVARDPVEVRASLEGLESGFWAVVVDFEGAGTAVRFADVEAAGATEEVGPGGMAPPGWVALDGAWRSSLDQEAYCANVDEIRARIAAGTVYQVNLCRVLSHELPEHADLGGLAALLATGNPAPYAGHIHVPSAGLDVVCASPEAFLLREGDRLETRPIKGTATRIERMLPKDYAENVMIVDLSRNDLSHVCRPGTVRVDHLCAPEEHPGLVHLVSTVSGQLREDVDWADIMAATFPPASVTGAPKSTALRAISDLEPAVRGPYCGAVGWIDAGRRRARLAVGIRSFWAELDGSGRRWLRFGTGAGITWDSDPCGEWEETQLKAARLIGLASGRVVV